MPMPLTMVRHLRSAIVHEAAVLDLNGNPVLDVHGAHTYAAAKTVMGRIEASTMMNPVAAHGREVVPSQILYLRDVYTDGTPVTTITHADRFTLPAGYVPRQAPPLKVIPWDHDLGRYGWEVVL